MVAFLLLRRLLAVFSWGGPLTRDNRVYTMKAMDGVQVSPHGSLSLLLLQSASTYRINRESGHRFNRERAGEESIGVTAIKNRQ